MDNQDKNNISNNNSGEIIIYEGADGAPSIEVRVEDETVWQLFGNSEQLSM